MNNKKPQKLPRKLKKKVKHLFLLTCHSSWTTRDVKIISFEYRVAPIYTNPRHKSLRNVRVHVHMASTTWYKSVV